MSNRSKSAFFGSIILVFLWILILILIPRQAARTPPAGAPGLATATPEPSRVESQGIEEATPSPVPPPTETPTPEPPPELLRPLTHLVQAGETLQMIADQYSTSVNLLAGYLTVDELRPGNEIIILAPNPAACPSQKIHLVVENETLYSLAQRYEVPLDALMAENHLTDPLIGIGSTLCIPSR